jgi:peptide/nickel transport system substrate-binding protein
MINQSFDVTRKLAMIASFLVASVCSLPANAASIPFFEKQIADGKLAAMAERLPKVPYKVDFKSEGKVLGKYGGTLRMLMGKNKDIGQITVYEYARLIGYDSKLNLRADVLESVEVERGRIFTLKIREGHKWSDGHLFTTEDFRYYWEDMIGHKDLGRAGTPIDLVVDGEGPKFEIIDDLTVRFSWAKPNPAFLPALARPSPLYIYRPAHYMKQFHEKYQDPDKLKALVAERNLKNWRSLHTKSQRKRRPENPDLPTLQPWRNTVKSPAQRYIFERNPYFHRVDDNGAQLPYIDKLIVDIVSKSVIPAKTGTGESDLQARYLRFDNFTFLKEAEEKQGFKVHLWSTGKGSQIALFPNLNTQDPNWSGLMRDVRFRRALSLGINRDEINEAIYFGLATPSANTVMPQSPLFKEEYKNSWASFDPEQANLLLDEVGLGARDDDGIRLLPDGTRAEITVESAGESTEETDVLELIADHWAKIGIKIFVRASQRDMFRRRARSGETQMSVFFGFNNAIATSEMSPEQLAPTSTPQLQWPKWGQYYETNGKAGEPPQLPEVLGQIEKYKAWLAAESVEERTAIWHEMLKTYTDQVFTIGTVNNTRQPIVVSKKLRNLPEEGIYTWEPTAYFGIYRPDTFWFEE